jgi:hypothetical protein
MTPIGPCFSIFSDEPAGAQDGKFMRIALVSNHLHPVVETPRFGLRAEHKKKW